LARTITIVGGGLVGGLLAIFLADRGHRVRVYERRSDPRLAAMYTGRSINLVVSHRGWTALRAAGCEDLVRGITVPVYARTTHDRDGKTNEIPYSIDGKAIHSVARAELNKLLLDIAERKPNVELFFDHRCVDVDLGTAACTFANADGALVVEADLVFGSDGAFSAVRRKMMQGRFNYSQEYIEHDYKEIAFAPNADGIPRLDPRSLHIWPRRFFMLMGLANQDGGFTGTLFMPNKATAHSPGFDTVRTVEEVRSFFSEHFKGLTELVPDVVEQYMHNAQSPLVIVRCDPWVHQGRVALIGDAAHAIVPFYGEGMNAGFEDCRVLADLFDELGDEELGEVSLRNFVEMRDLVADPRFVLRKRIEGHLQSRHPGKWLPLYSQVKFSDIAYTEALRQGELHDRVMEKVLALPNLTNEWQSEHVERMALRWLEEEG
jgi:kynurenine 3-monooxygenase